MINYFSKYFLFLFLFSIIVFGHGDEDHSESKKVDSEIASSVPSKEVLIEINELYKADVKPIFAKKCLACHGVNNNKPWYYVIPGAKHLMDYDMEEAKEHMDMSDDFPFAGHGGPIKDLKELKKTIQKGSMPPLQYKVIHWKSSLTPSEVEMIKNWIDKSIDLIDESRFSK